MRRSTLFWASILILLGVVLLVGNLFRIDAGKLFWPLAIIALGVWILWGVLAGPRTFETEQASIPLEGARQASVHVRHGAGRLRLSAGAGPDELASGTFGGGLEVQARKDGDTLDVEMRVRSGAWSAGPWMWGPGRTLDWTIRLNGAIPLALDFETGASDSRMDLSDLRVSDLRVRTGASATDITLPANAGFTTANIRSGAAAVNLRVPEGVAARIRARAGLGAVSVNKGRFPHVGEVYQSPDYDSAQNKVEIDVETGVGAVDVR